MCLIEHIPRLENMLQNIVKHDDVETIIPASKDLWEVSREDLIEAMRLPRYRSFGWHRLDPDDRDVIA